MRRADLSRMCDQQNAPTDQMHPARRLASQPLPGFYGDSEAFPLLTRADLAASLRPKTLTDADGRPGDCQARGASATSKIALASHTSLSLFLLKPVEIYSKRWYYFH